MTALDSAKGCSYEEISIEQLRQFRKLSFREKIQCLEQMAQVVNSLQGKAVEASRQSSRTSSVR